MLRELKISVDIFDEFERLLVHDTEEGPGFISPERSKRIDNQVIKFTAIRIYILTTVNLRFNVNALPGFMCLIWLNGLNFRFMLSTDISKIEYVQKIWFCNANRKVSHHYHLPCLWV